MTTSTYTVTLVDCRGCNDSDRREAEQKFCEGVEAVLGSEAQVAAAYAAYDAAFSVHEVLPLPVEATDVQRAAVSRWEVAEAEGWRRAFAGWHRAPEAAHFDISVAP